MTTTWIVAFVLLALLVTIETVLLLALMRQVGVLSLRIKPLPALVDDQAGPMPGTLLADEPLSSASSVDGTSPFTPERSLLFFISPTCSLCGSLLKPLAAIQRDHPGLGVFLVGEVEPERAADYARRAGTKLPVFVAPGLFEKWGIEGTPFAVIADRERRILRSGVVNTLEQIEVLIEGSEPLPEEERAAPNELEAEDAFQPGPDRFAVVEKGGRR